MGDDWRDSKDSRAEFVGYRRRLEGFQGFWGRICRVQKGEGSMRRSRRRGRRRRGEGGGAEEEEEGR